MNTKELFGALLAGKKMRRKCWFVDDYVYLNEKGLMKKSDDFIVGAIDALDWEEYKEPILTDKEKAYLSAIIKPFKDRVKYIYKKDALNEDKEYIIISLDDNDEANLPYFTKGVMYKGMEIDRSYTLEELGLE